MNEQGRDYKLQGMVLMGTGNYKDAQRMFKKALEIEECADLWIDLGNAYASNAEYNEAINAFSNALSYEAENAEILFDIGSVYLLQERLKKCIEYYNRAEEAGFDNVRLYMNLAAIYNALGDQQMELRNYTKAINKNPLIGDLYVKKAMLLLDMSRFEAALDVLDDMRKLSPDAFEGYDLAARIYLAQGSIGKAFAILDEGIKKFPNDVNLKLSKIGILTQEKEADQAETMLEELKRNSYADVYMRDILMQEVAVASIRNQPEQMKKLLLSIIEKETDVCDEQARFMLMMTCNLLEEYELAYEQSECLERQESNSTFAISGVYYKGEFLMKLGKTSDANIQFKKAIKKLRKISMSNRTYYEVYIYRALAHKQVKEYDKAIEMAGFIIDLQPEREDGYMILADIYKDMGEEEKSEQQFNIALEKNPDLKKE